MVHLILDDTLRKNAGEHIAAFSRVAFGRAQTLGLSYLPAARLATIGAISNLSLAYGVNKAESQSERHGSAIQCPK